MDQRTALMSVAAYSECKQRLRMNAERLLKQCFRSGPPYDPFRIASHMGVKVDVEPIPGLDGYVEVLNGKYFAVISSLTNVKRQRFTLSHELGHVLFMREAERGSPIPLIRYRAAGCPPGLHQDPIEENLCNIFASELLLPTTEVREEILATADPLASLLQLSNRFEVSLQAAAKRIIGVLGRKTVGCALWKNGEGKLWPMPLWSEGVTTTCRNQLHEIENMISQSVRKRVEVTCGFGSFGRKRTNAKVCVRPFGRRHSFIFVACEKNRPTCLNEHERFRRSRRDFDPQLSLF